MRMLQEAKYYSTEKQEWCQLAGLYICWKCGKETKAGAPYAELV